MTLAWEALSTLSQSSLCSCHALRIQGDISCQPRCKDTIREDKEGHPWLPLLSCSPGSPAVRPAIRPQAACSPPPMQGQELPDDGKRQEVPGHGPATLGARWPAGLPPESLTCPRPLASASPPCTLWALAGCGPGEAGKAFGALRGERAPGCWSAPMGVPEHREAPHSLVLGEEAPRRPAVPRSLEAGTSQRRPEAGGPGGGPSGDRLSCVRIPLG